MKKFKNLILFGAAFLVAALVLLVPTIALAQDSTAVASGATTSVISTIVGALELKWPVIATIGTILFFISEALSGIKSVKANGVFQLVSDVLKSLFSKSS